MTGSVDWTWLGHVEDRLADRVRGSLYGLDGNRRSVR